MAIHGRIEAGCVGARGGLLRLRGNLEHREARQSPALSEQEQLAWAVSAYTRPDEDACDGRDPPEYSVTRSLAVDRRGHVALNGIESQAVVTQFAFHGVSAICMAPISNEEIDRLFKHGPRQQRLRPEVVDPDSLRGNLGGETASSDERDAG